ncbi:cytosolic protein [Geobacillus sp. 46C-IIa]|uniref:cytosolic protein n=1 Tax=Geobacillus sp. 46C-IIa TaxID=1963025 RepID=UPI0009BDF5C7|nr:cytosolic protein [Geobacillus sp. 46C-IIa]OQP05498.1 cytosolic protein [Geobacillus sp. 46C-IIa]QNU29141.1 cytosolic protein [Geobacillus sp. 46C-IIa]
MKTFTVQFHREDDVEAMNVGKLGQEDFDKATEGGTRHLFDLDTNIGYFVFFDAEDNEGNVSYLMLQYEEESEDPSACYSFELKDFYEFMALYLNDLEYADEEELNEDGEEQYGPIHHLAHLLYHVVEEGKTVEV